MQGANDEDEAAAAGAANLLQIQDAEEWFRRNTLRQAALNPEVPLAQQEDLDEVKRAEFYQAQAHKRAFSGGDSEGVRRKEKQLQAWKRSGLRVEIKLNGSVHIFPLSVLAAQSDFVYTMASTRDLYKCGKRGAEDDCNSTLPISLEDFDVSAVDEFLKIVSFIDGVQRDNDDHISDYIRRQTNDFPLIACCRIAHFLQCLVIQNAFVDIFCNSIDTANCMSFYQLADELGLVRLSEVSLAHMMRTMGDVKSHDIWEDLSSELKTRIMAIQELLDKEARVTKQTSAEDPTRRQKVYFGSFHEYLSIFAEQVDYYRERLADAKYQQRLYVERLEGESRERNDFVNQEAREGRFHYHFRSNGRANNPTVNTNMMRYAQEKIDKQELRVKRLEACMAKQKLMFLGKQS